MKQETHSNSKTYLIIGGILVIGAVFYFFYHSGSNTAATASDSTIANSGDQSAAIGGDPVVGSDVLALLNKINSLRIDTSIFSDAAYQSLVDFSVEIPTLNVGRQNPFAPLPGSVAPAKTAPAATAASKTLPRK